MSKGDKIIYTINILMLLKIALALFCTLSEIVQQLSNSPLIHRLLAIGNNDLATFECLIRKISNNATIINKTLFQAAQYGNLEMVQFLVENASLADVNVLNEIGETPLFGATYEGHLKIVNYLLDKVI